MLFLIKNDKKRAFFVILGIDNSTINIKKVLHFFYF